MHPSNDTRTGIPFAEGSPRDPEYSYGSTPVGVETPIEAEVSPLAGMPFDPVLRQALIDKGMLTPQDLRDAERKITEISNLVNGVT